VPIHALAVQVLDRGNDMGLMLHNGRLLLAPSGLLAGSAACCCGGDTGCCACGWLEDYYYAGVAAPSSYRVKVTFSGPLSGYAILVAGGTNPACYSWTADGIGGDLSNVIDHCVLLLNNVQFYCPLGATSTDQWQLEITLGSASCNVVNLQLTQSSCGPPLYAVFTMELDDIFEGGCASGGEGCEDGTILTIEVENMDPWP
jgi:hypothetical protein